MKVGFIGLGRMGQGMAGRIHGAGDHGPNPAAEIAMQVAGRHVGLLPGFNP